MDIITQYPVTWTNQPVLINAVTFCRFGQPPPDAIPPTPTVYPKSDTIRGGATLYFPAPGSRITYPLEPYGVRPPIGRITRSNTSSPTGFNIPVLFTDFDLTFTVRLISPRKKVDADMATILIDIGTRRFQFGINALSPLAESSYHSLRLVRRKTVLIGLIDNFVVLRSDVDPLLTIQLNLQSDPKSSGFVTSSEWISIEENVTALIHGKYLLEGSQWDGTLLTGQTPAAILADLGAGELDVFGCGIDQYDPVGFTYTLPGPKTLQVDWVIYNDRQLHD